MQNKNLELWEQVCTTDPNHTKRVNQRGGFTAINATYQMRQATEQWGAYGSKWGVDNCKYIYVRDEKNKIIELALEAEFYYPDGRFPLSADARYSPGQDCRKKVLTDLTTKALSKLGFSADVFLGMYDDNKYINHVRAMFDKPANPASVKGAGVKRSKMTAKAFDSLVQRIQAGEEGLIEKTVEFFTLTADQKEVLKAYATTE